MYKVFNAVEYVTTTIEADYKLQTKLKTDVKYVMVSTIKSFHFQ